MFLLFETVLSKRIEITVISYLRKNKKRNIETPVSLLKDQKFWNFHKVPERFGLRKIFTFDNKHLDRPKLLNEVLRAPLQSTDPQCKATQFCKFKTKVQLNLSNSVLNFHLESCCTQNSGKTAIVQSLDFECKVTSPVVCQRIQDEDSPVSKPSISSSLPRRPSQGFVTRSCPTKRGAGTRDEPLRTSAWEAAIFRVTF